MGLKLLPRSKCIGFPRLPCLQRLGCGGGGQDPVPQLACGLGLLIAVPRRQGIHRLHEGIVQEPHLQSARHTVKSGLSITSDANSSLDSTQLPASSDTDG